MDENPNLDGDTDAAVLGSPQSQDADENPNLDELVRLLEDGDDETPPEDELARVIEARDIDEDHAAVPEAPQSPHARAQLVRRYLSSSSAKRRSTKDEHCNFCHLHLDRTNLEDHLDSAESCRMLYLRARHLKTVPGVMISSFGCLYCDEPFNKLQVHLRSTPNCLRQYFARFSVDTVE